MINHIANGYLGERHDGILYLVGRVCEPDTYTAKTGDIYMPNVGGGIFIPEGMRDAILKKEITGRLVPYNMLVEPMRIMDEDKL